MPDPARPRRANFPGLSPEAFSFFAGLAADNSREYFAAHAEGYRRAVFRPWRGLIAAVAAPLGDLLPDLETAVKTGKVISRLNRQWPRPGAAYHTGLRACFVSRGAGPSAPAALVVSLDAGGVGAGAEVSAGTPQWERVAARLAAGPWEDLPAALRWTVRGEPVEAGGAPVVLERMRESGDRGSVRLAAAWPADGPEVGTPELADAVLAALLGALPLYLWATATPDPRDVPGAADDGEWHLPPLPRELREAITARAARQGVSPQTYVVYLLARAMGG